MDIKLRKRISESTGRIGLLLEYYFGYTGHDIIFEGVDKAFVEELQRFGRRKRQTFRYRNITVSKLLGHKGLKIIQIYARILNEKKWEAVNKIPEL